MGERELVTEIRKIASKIKLEQGNLNLFMLLGDINEDTTNKISSFTVVVSAKWLDDKTPHEGTKIIAEYIMNHLTKEELSFISRITIINTSDVCVQNITRNIGCDESISWNYGCTMGHVYIPMCIIFESKFIA